MGLDETKIYYLNDAIGFSEVINEQQIPGAIISTISENIDRETREQLIARGVAPLQGIGDGLAAIKNVVEWFKNISNKLKINNFVFSGGVANNVKANKILADLFRAQLTKNGLDKNCVQFIEKKNRKIDTF